jgi:hypothetical protein
MKIKKRKKTFRRLEDRYKKDLEDFIGFNIEYEVKRLNKAIYKVKLRPLLQFVESFLRYREFGFLRNLLRILFRERYYVFYHDEHGTLRNKILKPHHLSLYNEDFTEFLLNEGDEK